MRRVFAALCCASFLGTTHFAAAGGKMSCEGPTIPFAQGQYVIAVTGNDSAEKIKQLDHLFFELKQFEPDTYGKMHLRFVDHLNDVNDDLYFAEIHLEGINNAFEASEAAYTTVHIQSFSDKTPQSSTKAQYDDLALVHAFRRVLLAWSKGSTPAASQISYQHVNSTSDMSIILWKNYLKD